MCGGFLRRLVVEESRHATPVGRLLLPVLLGFRLVLLAASGTGVFSDEQSEFVCHTQQPGCKAACYDAFHPLSPLRFWAFQVILVAVPSILYVGVTLYHVIWQWEAGKVKREEGTLSGQGEESQGASGAGSPRLLWAYVAQLGERPAVPSCPARPARAEIPRFARSAPTERGEGPPPRPARAPPRPDPGSGKRLHFAFRRETAAAGAKATGFPGPPEPAGLSSDPYFGSGLERHGGRGPPGGADLLHLPGLFRGPRVHRVRPQLLPRLPAPQSGAGRHPVPLPRVPAAVRARGAAAQLGAGPRLTEKTRGRRRQGPSPQGLCGRHWEPLRLFCEDDQRLVCLVCRESQEHQAHTMAPIDEAFESYREKLLKTQRSLTAKMKKALHIQDLEVKNATEWKEKMKNQRMRFSAEFAKLHLFLAEEEQLFLQRLSKEEEETKRKHKENTVRLNQMISSLKKLILEVAEKSQSSSLELLQNPKDVLTRSENQDVNYSFEVLKVKTQCQLPMMKEMLKRFQVAVNVAEDTAHPKLIFSQEGKYVKNGASASSWPLLSTAWSYVTGWRNPQKTTGFVERFQHLPCVLGKTVFTSGKHYWEVESRDGLEIAVGVCREDVMGITDGSRMSPELGIWALCWSSAGFRPLTSSPVSPTKPEPAPHRVGVFLDHGAGEISFYSAADGAHLHTFSCPVSRLRPFFWLSPLASLVLPPATGGK
ncbi:E3 ubiquitin-protein ligase TRIM4 [Camelus dromedarius]|uniref:E3 ubiquitin-protein ligase TRIM4 n=2 Tax=Camelus dromedarius TaxID=9838 RepID=A0A5N4CX34_CAMDR|nr:E3 ubiquitin-protein ligase TRIM4 [Camelus dromedarius]